MTDAKRSLLGIFGHDYDARKASPEPTANVNRAECGRALSVAKATVNIEMRHFAKAKSGYCLRPARQIGLEVDRQPKLSLEVIDRVIFHDRRGDLPDDRRLVGYFSSNRPVEWKEQPPSLTRYRVAVIDANIV